MTAVQVFIAPDGRLRAIWRFFLAVLVTGVARTIGQAASLALPFARLGQLVVGYAVTTGVLIGGFVLLLGLFDRVQSSRMEAMGLGRRRAVFDALMGTAGGGAMILAGVGAIAFFGKLQFTGAADASVGRTLAALGFVALAAMVEEMVFRGYPFQRLVESVGPMGAIAALSTLFGLGHYNNPNANIWGVLNTILVGVLLAVAYLRTRGLWLPWGIHFGWNALLGVGFGLPVSGTEMFAVVGKGQAAGPQWVTGGGYGIEASATATLIITVATVAVVKLVRQRPGPEVVLAEPGPASIAHGGFASAGIQEEAQPSSAGDLPKRLP